MRRIVTALLAVLLLGSVVGPVVAADSMQQQTERADLEIQQPHYIESGVNVEQSDGDTIYQVQGPRHEITLQNTNHSNVTAFGIESGDGSFTYDEERDVYVFDSEGAELTTQLYWVVDNGNSEVRKTAHIQVSNAQWVHRTQEEDQQLQEEVSAYRDIKQKAASVAPNTDVEQVIDDALGYYSFFKSPFSSVYRDALGTLIMFTRPGGLIVLGMIIGIPTILLAYLARYRNRTQKQFAELQDIKTEKDEAWLHKARKIIQQNDWNDLMPDDVSRAMRDYFGRNTWLGFKQYMLLRSPSHTKAVTLQAMAQCGYSAFVERDSDGELIAARAVHEDDPNPFKDTHGETADVVDLASLDADSAEDRAIIDAIPGDDIDESVWSRDDLDPAQISFPIDNREVSDADLLEEIDPNFPGDFEDEEHLARTLGKMLKHIENHDYYTDDEGRVKGEMDLLSFLSEMDTILSDEADFPVVHHQRKQLFWIADHMDKSEKLEERIDAIETDGITLADEIDRDVQRAD